MNDTVRTRFAPSPTGFLHIGGVRTALFNWLFARKHGGRFILRIDDTDRERNLEAALAPILHGFRWLGIDWDEGPEVGGEFGPYFQSQRLERYQAAARKLVDRGLAYHDYANTEELQQERETAQAEKRRFLYSRRWMARSPEDRSRFESEGRRGVVRLKMPREDTCRFDDHVRGAMEVSWSQEQDHVIQRADGSCLYHLASVVDDHEMGITHVIRAEEHLSNTPRQIFIARGLDYELPQYAHVPFVAEPGSKNKLSKRKLDKYLKNPDFARMNAHGHAIADAIGLPTAADSFNPVILDFYEQVGYLPDAIVNYLLLLGWSLDDKTENLERDEMIEHFSLERVNKAAASFDPKKLLSFQERRMQSESTADKLERVVPFAIKAGLVASKPTDAERRCLKAVVEAADDRIKVAGDIVDYVDFFTVDDELAYDETAVEKRLRKPDDAASLLGKIRDRLAAVDSFDAASLEQTVQEFLTAEGIKIGRIIHALRVAVTGKTVGFGLYETLSILGKQRCLSRIDRALALL